MAVSSRPHVATPEQCECHRKFLKIETHQYPYHFKIKVKVKITLEQATKAQRGSRDITTLFHLGAKMEWVINVTPRSLYPRERPDTHFTGGWASRRAGLEGCVKFRPHQDSIPGPPSP